MTLQVCDLFPVAAQAAATSVSLEGSPSLEDLLYPVERAAVANAVPKRVREFAAGRNCARRALASLGAAPIAIPMGKDRAPVWPSGYVGSISHSHGVCCAVAARREHVEAIGVDVELASPLSDELANRVCRRDELDHVSDLPALAKGDWFKLVFSAKETLYKCYYPLARSFLDFQDVSIRFALDPGSRSTGTFRGNLVVDRAWPFAGALEGRFRAACDVVSTGAAVVRAAPSG